MEMKNQYMMALVLGLLLLIAAPTNAQLDCVTGILPNLLPCQSFLTNLLPILPSGQCCTAVDNITSEGDTKDVCQCLKLNLLPAGILPFKLNLIPNLCNLSGLLPLVNCIIGGGKQIGRHKSGNKEQPQE